jgi:RNA polymerase sigma-70 factor (ECF subfamily)
VDDDELMARTAAGEEQAFQLLVERWERPLFGLLYHLMGSAEDALDLRQETFLRVYAEANRYRPQGRFRVWLFRVAGNLARSRLRRRRILRWVRFDPVRHDLPEPAADPEAALEREELRAAVRAALAGLPARQREAVVLRRFHDLSYREIAAVLGTTTEAVEALLQRAARALCRELGGVARERRTESRAPSGDSGGGRATGGAAGERRPTGSKSGGTTA